MTTFTRNNYDTQSVIDMRVTEEGLQDGHSAHLPRNSTAELDFTFSNSEFFWTSVVYIWLQCRKVSWSSILGWPLTCEGRPCSVLLYTCDMRQWRSHGNPFACRSIEVQAMTSQYRSVYTYRGKPAVLKYNIHVCFPGKFLILNPSVSNSATISQQVATQGAIAWRRTMGSVACKVMCDIWWIKWHRNTFLYAFLQFPLQANIPSLLQTQLTLPSEKRVSPNQAAYCHIRGITILEASFGTSSRHVTDNSLN